MHFTPIYVPADDDLMECKTTPQSTQSPLDEETKTYVRPMSRDHIHIVAC